jgi:hypothetical protein
MTPIYFPFTYVSQTVVSAFCSCFPEVIVYQPARLTTPNNMNELATKGLINIRFPEALPDALDDTFDDNRFNTICKDFKNWMDLHQGTEIDFLKAQMDETPFFDESSTFRISTDIRKKVGQKKHDQDVSDLYLKARIFLKFTQDFDMQNIEIDQRFKSCQEMEQDLFKTLKGEEAHLFEKKSQKNHGAGADGPSKDQGSYMTSERVNAWTRLVTSPGTCKKALSGLFITTSHAVFNFIKEKTPDAEKICEFDSIPISPGTEKEVEKWQKSLGEYINIIAQDPAEISSDIMLKPPLAKEPSETFTLKLFIAKDEAPRDFFARCAGLNKPENEKKEIKQELNINTTVFGHIDLN